MYLAIVFFDNHRIPYHRIFEIMVCKDAKPALSVNNRISFNRRFHNGPSLAPTEIALVHNRR